MESLADFSASLRNYIRESLLSQEGSDSVFGALALELFRLQFGVNSCYRRLCEARGLTPSSVSNWRDIPAVPTVAFKELELTSVPESERTFEFHSSGTTARDRSRHIHSRQSIADYEASLLPWFERHALSDIADLVDEQLLGPLDKLPMLFLTPGPDAAPNSSLVHMFEVVRRELGSRDSLFAGRVKDPCSGWALDMDRALFAIRKSMCANRPLVILGTAFNFVHLLDHFAANNMRYRLARGSRVVETGGYKGQAREVPKSELHQSITARLGISPQYIVTEYGMCELSCQAYSGVAGRSGDGVFHFPPWARAQIISPETGREARDGEKGLIRVFDLANVASALAIQTEDIGVRHGSGFKLIGRAPSAAARGCSLFSVTVSP